MTTPRFTIKQDDEYIIIDIHTPYVRVKDMEFTIEDKTLLFYCKPYHLRLTFSHCVVDDDERARAVYDIERDNGTITCHIPKMNKGEYFEDLDMISKLMTTPALPSKSKLEKISISKPLIEVLESEINEDGEEEEEEGERKEEIHTIQTNTNKNDANRVIGNMLNIGDTNTIEEPSISILLPASEELNYGFNNSYKSVFNGLESDLSIILEIPEPETTPKEERNKQREAMENVNFDNERYQLDFLYGSEDSIFIEAMALVPHWSKALTRVRKRSKSKGPERKSLIQDITHGSKESEVSIEDVTISISTLNMKDDHGHNSISSFPSIITTGRNESIVKLEDIHAHTLSSTSITYPITNTNIMPFVETEETFGAFTESEKDMLLSLRKKGFLIEDTSPLLLGLIDILLGYVYDYRTTHGDSSVESPWTISILTSTLSWLYTPSSIEHVCITFGRRLLIYPYLRHWDLIQIAFQDVGQILSLGKRRVIRCLLAVKKLFDHSELQYLLSKIYIDDYLIWIQSLSDEVFVNLGQEVMTKSSIIKKEDLKLNLIELEKQAIERAATRHPSGDGEEDSFDTGTEGEEEEREEEEVYIEEDEGQYVVEGEDMFHEQDEFLPEYDEFEGSPRGEHDLSLEDVAYVSEEGESES